MNSESSNSRLGIVAEMARYLDPAFITLPSTVRFPYPVVAQGELGLAAVIVHSGYIVRDQRTGIWFGPNDKVDPFEIAAEAALDLATVARAPADRVTAMFWATSETAGEEAVHNEQMVVSSDPEFAAKALQDLMSRRLTGSNEPTTPWLGAYAASALGPKDKMPVHLRRLIAGLEFSLNKAIGDDPVTISGYEISIGDLTDPQFLLPALVLAAAEDWYLPTQDERQGTGFSVSLQADASALLGYRLTDIQPAVPFTALAPILATARRTKEGAGYAFDDILLQFGRWLNKNGMDATVIDEIDHRLATSA